MESHSGTNCINCSDVSADLLRTQYPECHLKSRGKIFVKGKGPMVCFWVDDGDSSKARNHVLQRVMAKQRNRCMAYENQLENVPRPSIVDQQIVEESESDMDGLEGDLKLRLSRNGLKSKN